MDQGDRGRPEDPLPGADSDEDTLQAGAIGFLDALVIA